MAPLAAALIVLIGVAPGLADEDVAPATEELRVTLATSQTTWAVGEPMRFEATLTNQGNRTKWFDLFGDLDEIYEGKRRSAVVVSCWSLVWRGVEGLPGPRRGRYTLATEQFVRLAPGASYAKRLVRTAPELAPGRYLITLAYVPRMAGSSFSLPDRWEEQQGFADPMWIGMAYSNEVTVQIVGRSQAP